MHRWMALCGLCAALVLSACGDGGDDSPVVVRVDGESITAAEVSHRYAVKAKSDAYTYAMGGEPEPVVLPDPPEYERCIANLGGATEAAARAQLRRQCHSEHVSLRRRALDTLIRAAWIEQEVKRRGLGVSDAELEQTFEGWRKQNYPSDADYEEYLETSGLSEEDIKSDLLHTALYSRVQADVIGNAGEVGRPQIARYFRLHRSQFRPLPAAGGASSAERTLEGYSQLIVQLISEPRIKRAQARFDSYYEDHWIAKTHCEPGYVVPICRNSPESY